jgi:hypothetical protein
MITPQCFAAKENALLGRLRLARAQPEPAERRRDLRHSAVFQVAKLKTDRIEELCMVRDVSPHGLKAEVYYPLQVGEAVRITLRTEHAMVGRVVWMRDQMVGVEFDDDVHVLGMLAHCAVDDRIGGIRPPRLESDFHTFVRLEGREFELHVSNVSQAGMKITVPHAVAPETRCDILIDMVGWREGTIRWHRGGEAGILLAQPLSYKDFALWRQSLATRRKDGDETSV